MRILAAIVLLTLILLSVGCAGVSSQYLLYTEYVSPNTGRVEVVEVPVSQYVYEQTNVGDTSTVTIHTTILGLKVPITRETSTSMIAILDTIPSVFGPLLIAIPLGYLVFSLLKRRSLITPLVMLVVGVGVSGFMYSTLYPEFTTLGIVVDKTFRIAS